jgi:hypothetical protein
MEEINWKPKMELIDDNLLGHNVNISSLLLKLLKHLAIFIQPTQINRS